MRDPEKYRGGMRSLDGSPFVVGDQRWQRNPMHVVPRAFMHIARLWGRCRAGMGGLAMLPEAGGINDQPAWLMAALGICDAANAAMDEAEREGGAA